MNRRASSPLEGGLGEDPLSADEVLQHRFFAPEPGRKAPVEPSAKPKPSHYRVISISLYEDDFARLEAMVAELKRRGNTKANKSQLIRQALRQVDLDQIPSER